MTFNKLQLYLSDEAWSRFQNLLKDQPRNLTASNFAGRLLEIGMDMTEAHTETTPAPTGEATQYVYDEDRARDVFEHQDQIDGAWEQWLLDEYKTRHAVKEG